MCAATDFLFWLADGLVEIKGKQYEDIVFVKIEGPLSYFSRTAHIIGVAGYITTACLSMTALPAQAYFRYYALTQ
ncbi:unnamed protein product [Bursaphelenchus okinawaensis]|uniref:Uncharacterized protein n=1 Tax=Bursaphelenchus okinawaensis TaxID=465554 RepID=A0A811KQL5_9BILA|nr:unnamed protein product [Bursaphelenchus okinawaensis]CAG9108070.1 unnamed protein product [Bursaphelenchus okinawaensis]